MLYQSPNSWYCLTRHDFVELYGVPAAQFHAVIAPMGPQMRIAVMNALTFEGRRTRAWLWAKTQLAQLRYALSRYMWRLERNM